MNKARTLAQMREHSHGLVVSRLRYRINPTRNEERDYVEIRIAVRKHGRSIRRRWKLSKSQY